MEDYEICLIIINIFGLVFCGMRLLLENTKIKKYMDIFLVFISLFGGSIGSLFAMYLFRHKTNKTYFKFGVPIIFVTQTIFFFFLINL